MNVLALDSSGDCSAVGIAATGGRAWEGATDSQRKHGRDLMPLIRVLLDSAGLKVADLALIAVGLGPGSYTGLRIGLTAARTLAYAAGARLVGFDSLEAHAQSAPDDALWIQVIADAQRGDVYLAEFEREGPGAPPRMLAPSRIEPVGRWIDRLQGGAFVMGPGLNAPSIRSLLPPRAVVADADRNRPSGLRLLDLARRVAAGGADSDLFALEPNYLRRSAAEDKRSPRSAAR